MLNCINISCRKPLIGRQQKYCSGRCKSAVSNKSHQSYEAQQVRGYLRKNQLVQYLGGKCEICGYDKSTSALCFHHINPALKIMALSLRECSNNKWEVLQTEANKCRLLCANCHMEEHYG